jgi:hypothetical protein
MANLIAQRPEGTGKKIVGYIGPKVSYMGIVVYRGTTAIKTRLTGFYGTKKLRFPAKGIKEG